MFSYLCRGSSNKIFLLPGRNRFPISYHAVSRCVHDNTTVPTKKNKLVGKWLFGLAGMTFGAVVIGGLTRLTRSGLSIVDWHPFKEAPPLSHDQWFNEFEKYKRFPEYEYFVKEHGEMSLSRFKFIWYMEYAHRMWGRAIGAVYALPAVYFLSKGYLSSQMKPRVFIYGSFIGLQGILGWLMVRSGLQEPRRPAGLDDSEQYAGIPRVDHRWLSAHLSSAVVLYTLFLWSAMNHLVVHPKVEPFKGLKRLKALTYTTKTLAFTTIIFGAFVAGMDAGLVYNSWPKMGDKWIPDDLISPIYGSAARNMIDNPVGAQFMHRTLAYGTVTSALLLWANVMSLGLNKTGPRIRMASHLVLGAALGQATLGITALVHYVPLYLAAMHQSGSLILFSSLMWFANCLRAVPK